MGYEYKEEILLDIGPEPNCNYESESNRYYDKIDELDHVYAQATKADEYEAKAKAYDDTLKTLDKLINDDERYKEARSNDFIAGMLIAYEKIFYLMEDYIKESGEPNA